MNIGSVNQLEHKVVVLPLNSYQCKLPCDLERLNSVAYSTCSCGGWIPMKRTTGTFSVYDKKCCHCDCDMIIQDSAMFPIIKNMFNLIDDKQALDKLNSDDNLRKTLSCLINQYTICSKNGKIPARPLWEPLYKHVGGKASLKRHIQEAIKRQLKKYT